MSAYRGPRGRAGLNKTAGEQGLRGIGRGNRLDLVESQFMENKSEKNPQNHVSTASKTDDRERLGWAPGVGRGRGIPKQENTRKVKIPSECAGMVIGKAGAKIRELKETSGAIINIPSRENRGSEVEVELSGTDEQMNKAQDLIEKLTLTGKHKIDDVKDESTAASGGGATFWGSANYGAPVEDKFEDAEEQEELIDWGAALRECNEAQKLKWSKLPELIKDFYKEHPDVAAMSDEEVRDFRRNNNNIEVKNFKEDDDTPLLKPVTKFHNAFGGEDTPAVSIEVKGKSASSNLTPNKTQERKMPAAQFIRITSSQKNDIVEGTFKKLAELDIIKLFNPELLHAIKLCGFIHPSDIQKECLPAACTGQDLLCQAKSGTGKTLVFVLAVLQQIAPRDGQITALVMCPTRELAIQIADQFKELIEHILHIKVAVFFGGVPVENDKKILKENCPHIVVGTPGRVLDLVSSKCLPLENIKHFILDECDKMIENLEMRQDVQKVYVQTPREKQVMMFSATMKDAVKNVCRKFMRNQCESIIEDDTKLALKNIQQFFISLEGPQKRWELVKLLNTLHYKKVFVFVRTVARCDDVALFLKEKNFNAIPIHGVLKQQDRIANYEEFEKLPRRIMVATQVFSRGMDITDGNVVVNYDMSENTDDYLRRVGRGGRFGTKALSISFVTKGGDELILKQVEERFGIKIQPFDLKHLC